MATRFNINPLPSYNLLKPAQPAVKPPQPPIAISVQTFGPKEEGGRGGFVHEACPRGYVGITIHAPKEEVIPVINEIWMQLQKFTMLRPNPDTNIDNDRERNPLQKSISRVEERIICVEPDSIGGFYQSLGGNEYRMFVEPPKGMSLRRAELVVSETIKNFGHEKPHARVNGSVNGNGKAR